MTIMGNSTEQLILVSTPGPCGTFHRRLQEEPDLIGYLQEDLDRAGLVGEKENGAIIFLSGISARLDTPLNTTVQGSSAAGKNFLIGKVAAFLPPEMVKFLTGMSPKVLMHSAEDEYEHKAVFIAEYEGVAGADFGIRTFQSAQVIEWEFVESSKNGIRKQKRRVKGPAAFIQATTRPVLHPENETRLLFVGMDESQEQTRAILHQQAVEAAIGGIEAGSDLFQPWQELVRNLTLTRVVIPFANQLVPHFPADRVRSRRDFSKLLGMIEASAFLHQHQREKEGNEIIADARDYRIAKELFEHAYATGPDSAVEELSQAAESLKFPGQLDFTVADLMTKLGWGKSKTYEVLRRAEELGRIGETGSRGSYLLLHSSPNSGLNLPDTLAQV